MFKGETFEEFHDYFKSEFVCRQYLFDLKWSDGYCCKKCGFNKFWKGRTALHARCARCDYDESVTAHTIFHKIQIPLLKAFSIAFHIVVLKKGISTNDAAEVYGINQKTAWRFQRRAQEAMGAGLSEDGVYLDGVNYTLDSIAISHREKRLNGLQRVNLVVSRKKIKRTKMVQLRGIRSMPTPTTFDNCQLVAGHYVNEGKSIRVWNCKTWLTGIHHHCSDKYLQGYLDQYYFKQSYLQRKEIIFHTLITQMVKCKPLNFNTRAA